MLAMLGQLVSVMSVACLQEAAQGPVRRAHCDTAFIVWAHNVEKGKQVTPPKSAVAAGCRRLLGLWAVLLMVAVDEFFGLSQ